MRINFYKPIVVKLERVSTVELRLSDLMRGAGELGSDNQKVG